MCHQDLQRFGLARAIIAVILMSSAGCSSWPWKSGGRDAERLTRVIHAENARLKDVVVQLRSSNEDMAQRSLDDASRIALLEEENEKFRTSVAAYQSERERMARSFQNLQEQVQLALGDRSEIRSTSFVGQSGKSTPDSAVAQILEESPPAGRIDMDRRSLVISIEDWFVPGTAIMKPDAEMRANRLGRWLSTRIAADGVVRFRIGNDYAASATESSDSASDSTGTQAEIQQNRRALDAVRARRLWQAILAGMPAESDVRVRFDDNPQIGGPIAETAAGAQLFVPISADQ
jgi:hypothetical protein